MEVGFPLPLGDSVGDAISRLRFAPRSSHLLVSSWDSSVLRLDVPSTAAVLHCCFRDEHVAFSVDADCYLKRSWNFCGKSKLLGDLCGVFSFKQSACFGLLG